MKIAKYDVWSLDVWGNDEDGYFVNDRVCFRRAVGFPTTHKVYNEGTPQEFSEDWPTDEQIVETLIDIGFLREGVSSSALTIDGDMEFSVDIDEDGYPLCQLEFVGKGDTRDISQDDKTGKFYITEDEKEVAGPFETEEEARKFVEE